MPEVSALLGPQPVLVVDDDPVIQDLVAAILRDEGYRVETAGNGEEALARLESRLPSVVLLDMRMPVLDGWGLSRALKERGIRVPLIVMSAARDARRWCREIEADACLPKPFDVDEMVDTVARFAGPPTA